MKRIVFLTLFISISHTYAGSFIFAGDTFGVDLITHPQGFSASPPDVLEVEVCIDPTSTETTALEVSVRNIVDVFNQLEATNGNLVFGGSNNIPTGAIDWESVALHEVGHCIGLAHPNLGSQTGVTGGDTNYTQSTKGGDGSFDFGAGSDVTIGSSDDVRDDDVNLHWFNIGVNNPFIASPPYDSTKYSRDVADLPGGHLYPANADIFVGADLGFSDSEAVMQQGSRSDEDQRRLGIDDVATLSLGMSGIDMTANTADDYKIQLIYGGIQSSCDINIKHHATPSFAFCSTGGSSVTSNHWRITSANIELGDGFNWFFNTQRVDLIYKNGFD